MSEGNAKEALMLPTQEEQLVAEIEKMGIRYLSRQTGYQAKRVRTPQRLLADLLRQPVPLLHRVNRQTAVDATSDDEALGQLVTELGGDRQPSLLIDGVAELSQEHVLNPPRKKQNVAPSQGDSPLHPTLTHNCPYYTIFLLL